MNQLQSCTGLLERLVAIPSCYPPGDTSEICRHIASLLTAWHYQVEVVSRAAGVDNVVATLDSSEPGPCVVFNSHIDTVSVGNHNDWQTAPLSLVPVAGGRLAGLGAANCKGSAATQLWLAQTLAGRGGPRRGKVVFTFVGDEENLGPDGMRYLADAGLVKPDLLILGAPTANQLVVRERGVMWVKVSAFGRGAHAGAPTAGDNAIARLLRLAHFLERRLAEQLAHRSHGTLQSTFNIGTISGGENTNVVPAFASFTLDRRLLPDSENVRHAFDEIVAILAQAGEAPGSYAVELLTGTNGFSADPDGPLVQAFQQSAQAVLHRRLDITDAIGASDGRYFANTEMEIINFGPGEGSQGHAPNESVACDELEQACQILGGVLEQLTGYRN